MSNNREKKVAIYSRKSKLTAKGESIENQVELCKNYIKNNLGICEEILVFEDEGFSGRNTERPEFKKMINSAKNRKISTIVCYRLDRISRNISDFTRLIEELDKLGIDFISIKEQFDTSSPMGRAMMYISSVFSQLERETIAERIRDNMNELAKTGRWLGGITPTGYYSENIESISKTGKKKKYFKLTIIDDEALLVKLIFKIYSETGSITKTENFLNTNGFTSKNGNKFSRYTVKNILTNPVYMIADEDSYSFLLKENVDLFSKKEEFNGEYGIMAYNKTIQKIGQAHELTQINQWTVAVGKHIGIIDGKKWSTVYKSLEKNKSRKNRKSRKNEALLSDILFCEKCGQRMRPKLTKKYNSNGEIIFTYICTLKESSRKYLCDNKNINGNFVDKVVCDEIKKIKPNNEKILKKLNKSKEKFQLSKNNFNNVENKINENEKKIEKLISSLVKVSGTSTEEILLKKIGELNEEIIQVKLNVDKNNSIDNKSKIENKIEDFESFYNIFQTLTIEQKRIVLGEIVEKVTFNGEDIDIYFK